MILLQTILGITVTSNNQLSNALLNKVTPIQLANQNFQISMNFLNIDQLDIVGPATLTYSGSINVNNKLNWQNIAINNGNLTISGNSNSKITISSQISNSILNIAGDSSNIVIVNSNVVKSKLSFILKNSAGLNITKSIFDTNSIAGSASSFIDCSSSTVLLNSFTINNNTGLFLNANQCYLGGNTNIFSNNKVITQDPSFAYISQTTIEMKSTTFTSNLGGRIGLIQMLQSSGYLSNSIISQTTASLINILGMDTNSDLQLINVEIKQHAVQGVRLIQVAGQSHLSIQGSNIHDNANGWFIGVFSDSHLSMTASVINKNTWISSTPLYISGSSVVSLTNNDISSNSYGVYFVNSDYQTTLSIDGLTSFNNIGSTFIRFLGSILTINNANIHNNQFSTSEGVAWLLMDGIESSNATISSSNFHHLQFGATASLVFQSTEFSNVIITSCTINDISGNLFTAASPLSILKSTFSNIISPTSAISSSASLSIQQSKFNFINGTDGAIIYASNQISIATSTFTNIHASHNGAVAYCKNALQVILTNNTFTNTSATASGGVFYDDSPALTPNFLNSNIFKFNAAAVQGNIIASPPHAISSNISSISIVAGHPIPPFQLQLIDKYNQTSQFDSDPNLVFLANIIISTPSYSISGITHFTLINPYIPQMSILAPFGSYALVVQSLRNNYNLQLSIPLTIKQCPIDTINVPIASFPNCRAPICPAGCSSEFGKCTNDNICTCSNGYDGMGCFLKSSLYDTITIYSNLTSCANPSYRDIMISQYESLLSDLGDYTLVYRHTTMGATPCSFTFSVMDANGNYVEGDDLTGLQFKLNELTQAQSTLQDSYKAYVVIDTLIIIMTTLVLIGVLVTTAIIFVFIRYRKTPVVKSSSLLFNSFILIGILLGFASLLVEIGIPNLVQCGARIWIYPVAFVCIYGSMLLKTRRIYKIFNNSSGGQLRHLSDLHMASQFVVLMIICGVICMVYSVANPALPLLILNGGIRGYYCISTNHTLTLVLQIMLVILGFMIISMCTYYCINTRNSQGAYKESGAIGICVGMILVLGTFGIPILLFVELQPNTRFILLFVVIIMNMYTILGVYYGRRVYIMVFRPDLNNLQFLNKDQSIRNTISTEHSIATRELVRRASRRGSGQLALQNNKNKTPIASAQTVASGQLDNSNKTLGASLEVVQLDIIEKCRYKESNEKFKNGHLLVFYESEHCILSIDKSGEEGIVLAFDELEIEDCLIYEQSVRFICCEKHYFVSFRKMETKTRILNMFNKQYRLGALEEHE